VITQEGIDKRIARLLALAVGLGKESSTFRGDALSPTERRDYVNYVLDALAAVDAARVVLERVRKRLAAERLGRNS